MIVDINEKRSLEELTEKVRDELYAHVKNAEGYVKCSTKKGEIKLTVEKEGLANMTMFVMVNELACRCYNECMREMDEETAQAFTDYGVDALKDAIMNKWREDHADGER